MEVGFIGLGGMGSAMAANLVNAGHTVKAWNRSPAPLRSLAQLGAISCTNAKEAFGGEVVISMLADDDSMEEVIVKAGLIEAAPSALIHVNMATISVAFARKLAGLHKAAGSRYISAPVFGRTEVAAAGKLNIVAAGDTVALDQVQPLFDLMGQKTWRLGDRPENANVVKIAGNFMLASAIETLAEASALVNRHGVPESQFMELMTSTLFAAPAYKTYGQLIASRHFEPAAFRLALGLKDVRLALASAFEARVPMPFARVLHDNFLDAVAHGEGDLDWSALAAVVFRHANLVHDYSARAEPER